MPVEAILPAIIVILLIAAVVVTLARDFSLWASGREQLRNAVVFRNTAEVQNILDASPHLAGDPEALFSAIFHQRDEILVVLLERGADVSQRLEWGGAPLHIAARYGTVESAQVILARGADINEDCNGVPLYWAADQGRLDVVELLLNRGANAMLVAVDEIGRSSFKPKSTNHQGFETIRQRVAEAQQQQTEPV